MRSQARIAQFNSLKRGPSIAAISALTLLPISSTLLSHAEVARPSVRLLPLNRATPEVRREAEKPISRPIRSKILQKLSAFF